MTRRITTRVDSSYLVVSAALIVLMLVQTLNRQWSTDWYLHASAVRELTARLFHPHHPLTGTGDADPELSPYQWVLAAVARVTGLDVVAIMSIAAMVNLVGLLVAFRMFVRCFSTERQAPTWGLLFALVLWGVNPWRWSGYVNLNSIGFGLPYPSMAALVLVLFALVLLVRWCERPRLGYALGAAALGAVAALAHPVTLIGAVLATGAILVWRWSPVVARSVWHLALAGAVGVGILAVWPLSPFFSIAGGSEAYDFASRGIYRSVLLSAALLLVSVPALVLRWRRDRRDALVLLACSATVVYVVGWSIGPGAIGRVFPFAALAAQVALAVEVSARIAAGDRRVRIGAIAVVVVGVACCVAAVPRFVPRQLLPGDWRDRAELAPVTAGSDVLALIPPDSVTAAETHALRIRVPAFGGKNLAPGYEAVFVDDAETRARDEARLFSTADPAVRRRIIDRYGVRWIALDPAHRGHVRDIESLGKVVRRTDDVVLIEVDAPRHAYSDGHG